MPVNMFYGVAAHCIYLYLKCMYVYIYIYSKSARCLRTLFCITGVPQVPTKLDSLLTLLHWLQLHLQYVLSAPFLRWNRHCGGGLQTRDLSK